MTFAVVWGAGMGVENFIDEFWTKCGLEGKYV